MRCVRLLVAFVALLFSPVAVSIVTAQGVGLTSPLPFGPGSQVQPTLPGQVKPVEDWSDPKVNLESMQAVSFAIIGSSETPDFTRELIRVQWRAADPIDLFVIKPHGIQKPPVILYLYGYPNDEKRFWDDGWCRRATQGGFAAVGFVSALTGQRYTSRPMKEWFVSELQESLGTTTHDVPMILDYLVRRGDLTVNQVGMFGQGSGGTIALLAAAFDRRIAVVDVLNPWGDWPEWFATSAEVPEEERANYLKPEFLKRLERLDPLMYLPALQLKALRVQQVLNEPVTPANVKAKFDASAQKGVQVLDYKDEQEHLKEWRVTGLSCWIRAKMLSTGESTPSQGTEPSRSAGGTGDSADESLCKISGAGKS